MLIKGKKYNLREIRKEDLPLKVRWINDPKVHVNLHYDIPITLKKTTQWFERTQNDSSRLDLIIETLTGTPVGLIGLLDISERDKTTEIYIAIGETEYWGKGAMLETESMLIEYVIRELNLYKILAQTRPANIGSIITMKKLGFQIEGTLRQEKCIQGERVDILIMGLLKDEFNCFHEKG
ncbi:MAG: hypothetical protein DRP56_01180 [Planctomycetota bacterium]|nr:MAG: hypothetical protein DRP56_01180 [Planctomycetota bacterium]